MSKHQHTENQRRGEYSGGGGSVFGGGRMEENVQKILLGEERAIVKEKGKKG